MVAIAPFDRQPPRLLPLGATFDSVARAARLAGLAFVNGGKWKKRDLAAWLVGAYGRATAFGPKSSLRPSQSATRAKTAAERAPIPQDAIARLLGSTRWRVLSALENAALPRGTFAAADRAIALRHIELALDSEGNLGWLPVDGSRMSLADRVLSLFAVDYLTRPRDYTRTLNVCHYCEAVSFDATARDRGGCTQAVAHFAAASNAVANGR